MRVRYRHRNRITICSTRALKCFTLIILFHLIISYYFIFFHLCTMITLIFFSFKFTTKINNTSPLITGRYSTCSKWRICAKSSKLGFPLSAHLCRSPTVMRLLSYLRIDLASYLAAYQSLPPNSTKNVDAIEETLMSIYVSTIYIQSIELESLSIPLGWNLFPIHSSIHTEIEKCKAYFNEKIQF